MDTRKKGGNYGVWGGLMGNKKINFYEWYCNT